MTDLVIVGAGPAGLTAAWVAASRGRSVHVLAAGWGSLMWHTGTVDVLAAVPGEGPVEAPRAAIGRLPDDHPYRLTDLDRIERTIAGFASLCSDSGYRMVGSLDENLLLPTHLGAARPTCMAPFTMTAGDLRRDDPMLLVGFDRFLDFPVELAAANLATRLPARATTVDLPGVTDRRFLGSVDLARALEDESVRAELADRVGPRLGRARRVGFPAVLGIREVAAVHDDLTDRLGVEVFEVPIPPPSVPGIRLQNLLVEAVEKAGGSIQVGSKAVGATISADRVEEVNTEAAARTRSHRADRFVLATGGIGGGGLLGQPDGRLVEPVFGLDVAAPPPVGGAMLPGLHHLRRVGISVDRSLRPVGAAENLRVAGSALAGADRVAERSRIGISIVTGYLAGKGA